MQSTAAECEFYAVVGWRTSAAPSITTIKAIAASIFLMIGILLSGIYGSQADGSRTAHLEPLYPALSR